MIQTHSFWQRPYWQRLCLGIGLLPVVLIAIPVELLAALMSGLIGTIKQIVADLGRHLVHLYRFYRYDVLSRCPEKHLPQPDPEYWEAQ